MIRIDPNHPQPTNKESSVFTTRSPLFATRALPYLLPLAVGCGAAVERPGFEAEVRGAIETTLRGTSAFAPSGLTLSAGDTNGTLVFAASDGAGLTSGSYDVGPTSSNPGSAPFVNALFIAGTPSRPMGVFRGSAGALTITTATKQRLAGRFELDAVGVLADADAVRTGSTDSVAVRVSGSFLVLDPCSAANSQAAAPCVRRFNRAGEVRLRAGLSPQFEPSTRFLTLDDRK
jgi:hypothetical protein